MSPYDLQEKEAMIFKAYMFLIVLSKLFCNLFLIQALKGNYFYPHYTLEEFTLTEVKKHIQGHMFYI